LILMKLGFHVSIEGGLHRAVGRALEVGCTTFQMFTRSPRMWKHRELRVEEIQAFRANLEESGISPVFGHMPYLPNLASPRDDIYGKSVESLKVEAERCRLLGVPYLVTHLGSSLGAGHEAGSLRVAEALRQVAEDGGNPVILLENTSGKRNEVGSTFPEISGIMALAGWEGLGVCLDVCHAYARGYNVRTAEGLNDALMEMDRVIGLDRLRLVHLNDSVGALGSRIDRHEHIGLGAIGEDGFRNILRSRLRDKPMIMETPVNDRRTDEGNMQKARELADLHVNQ
jgi:deoxyribonuclease-4